MSSTYSTNLAIELIGTGDQAGNWGSTTNTNLGTLLEQAISGYVTQAVSTGTDTTLAMTNGASATARNIFIELTGTGGASTNLIVPSNKKLYFIYNNTTGAVTVKVTGLTGVSVPAAAKIALVSNGTDIVVATNYMASLTLGAALPVASGGTGVTTSTGTGNTVLSASPTLTGTPIAPTAAVGTNTTQIATTAFVAAASGSLGTMSTQNANNVAITGGTITGLSSALPVASGGTGVTTSTGSGANVLASGATLTSPTINSPTFGGTPTMGASFITKSSTVSASGTTVDFTGIPSWVNSITVMLRGLSTNGTSYLLIQIGTSGGFTTSGYMSTSIDVDNAGGSSGADSTAGFVMKNNGPNNIFSGLMSISGMGSNVWVSSHSMKFTTTTACFGGGDVGLGGAIERVRITTVNGTDSFDAGTVNISYQ